MITAKSVKITLLAFVFMVVLSGVAMAPLDFSLIYNPYTGKFDYYTTNSTHINCSSIVGSPDTDFCTDATGTGEENKKADGYFLYNDSTTYYFNQTLLNITIEELDTDTTYSENSPYLDLVGTVFSLVESYLNGTIDQRLNWNNFFNIPPWVFYNYTAWINVYDKPPHVEGNYTGKAAGLIDCASCVTDAMVSDTLTASDLVAGSSVVSDSEVDNDITIASSSNISTTQYVKAPFLCIGDSCKPSWPAGEGGEEIDPLWEGNQSLYYTKTESNATYVLKEGDSITGGLDVYDYVWSPELWSDTILNMGYFYVKEIDNDIRLYSQAGNGLIIGDASAQAAANSLIPFWNNQLNLGNSSNMWKSMWLAGDLFVGGVITGTLGWANLTGIPPHIPGNYTDKAAGLIDCVDCVTDAMVSDTLTCSNMEGTDWGTLTDGYYCTYDSAGTEVDCNTQYATASSDSTWTLHNSYPSACTEGNYVQGIGDTLTCTLDDDQPDNDNEVPDDITVDTTKDINTTKNIWLDSASGKFCMNQQCSNFANATGVWFNNGASGIYYG